MPFWIIFILLIIISGTFGVSACVCAVCACAGLCAACACVCAARYALHLYVLYVHVYSACVSVCVFVTVTNRLPLLGVSSYVAAWYGRSDCVYEEARGEGRCYTWSFATGRMILRLFCWRLGRRSAFSLHAMDIL